MPISILEEGKLIIAQETNIELEQHLENWLEDSPRSLTGERFLWIGRQTNATDEGGTIYSDLLGVDIEGNLVIAELKRDRTPRDIIAQLLDYAAWASELSETQIQRTAEAYFETREVFKGKTFNEAFRDEFDMTEIDEIPSLNQGLRLFVIAEEILPRIARVCRFLRTSYGMNISCIDVSIFETESGEILVSTEAKVGDEDFTAPKVQKQKSASPPSRWSGDKLVKEVVWEAVQELTQGKTDVEFSIRQVTATILKKDSDFKEGTVNGQITADCVNHPSRHHHPSAKEDYYWRIGRGRYRLYDPEKDKIDSDKKLTDE